MAHPGAPQNQVDSRQRPTESDKSTSEGGLPASFHGDIQSPLPATGRIGTTRFPASRITTTAGRYTKGRCLL